MLIVRRHTLLVKTERGFFMSNSLNGRKVAVIGCGFVGSTTAYSLMQSKFFTDMVLIDVDTNRAEGEALDISHGIPYYSPMYIYAGTYEDLSDASIVIITAGANQKPGETRLDLVQKNVAIFKTIVPRIMEQGFDGIFLVVSNPVDILTQVVMELSGLPRERVMGSGTVLDSARLKYTLGHMLDVDPRHVHARIIGEHGDSELAVWSAANVSGIGINDFFRLRGIENATEIRASVEESVRNSAYEIIEKKRATYFGIAPSVTRICEAIVRDQKSIMTVSNYRTDVQGVPDVVMSLPAIVGSKGVEFPIPLQLSIDEAELLHSSAQTLKNTLNQIDFSL